MPVNKKSAKRAYALRLTDARKANLASARRAAFNAGTSRNTLLAAIFAACGKRPVLTLSDAVRLEVVIGLMASALARGGDNRPEAVLMEHCRSRLTHYQGHGGKGKLRAGMKGRRTAAEEAAYLSARVQWSGLAKDAGVILPVKSGSTSSGRPKGKGAGKSSAKAKAANDSKPIVRTFKSADRMVEYALIQAKAMQGTLNKSAAHCPARLGKAINAFVSEVLAIAKGE